MKPEKSHCCLVTDKGSSIPLEGVSIEGKVSGRSSRVTVRQRYHNTEKVDVEAVYVFPLEEGSAVCGFEARVGERVLKGQVEEKERAFEIYDDAMSAGHGAFLLDQERPDVFTASVGNLKSGQQVEIAITYVALLQHEGPAIRFRLPTTISPRYVPAGPPEVGEPDGERVNPPVASQVPYGLTLKIQVSTDSGLKQIESPSHTIRTTLDGSQGATVELTSEKTALDRDFCFAGLPPRSPSTQRSAGPGRRRYSVAMLNFFPDPLGLPSLPNEVLFLLDCSGSMMGDSISQARRALLLCVRALSEGDTFNVVRFGSSFQSLWKKPKHTVTRRCAKPPASLKRPRPTWADGDSQADAITAQAQSRSPEGATAPAPHRWTGFQ